MIRGAAHALRFTGAVAVLCLGLPLGAVAQPAADDDTQPPPPTSQGPMTVERMHSGFMFAPEVKVTDFDRHAEGLVGGSAGWVAQESVFIGGGGYWMPTDRGSDRRLAYGGFVMQWFLANSDRLGVSAKALIGGGRARTPETVTQVVGPFPVDFNRLNPQQRADAIRARTITTTIGLREDFVVAEPELNARLGLTRHVRLTVGAGYRFAGDGFRRFGRSDRISGAVGTLGLQIGG